ncbi:MULTISPECIES: tRNA (adenosine(37)-N6)-threonylcarbamoyltransferase complex ATPase subunit type 1 TsaE [Frankiaceae]|uniref:tRNA (adenosine(37)-N6)-threonylcarbamoyltransferase complex ATPase subunit type 1 TsaE n=1 Tax=Protofrankia TaxID=2994361 RepID=UPI0005BE760D
MVVEAEEADDTREVGRRLAAVLRAGDLVILAGPLGAGKTVFVQGVAAGLGVAGAVTSPTFVIARVHRGGRVPLVHVDAYRLGGLAEVEDIDLDADVERSVTVVEWGSGLVEGLAGTHLRVEIARPEDAAPASPTATDTSVSDASISADAGDSVGAPASAEAAGAADTGGVPDAGGQRVIRMAGSGGDWPRRLSLLVPLPSSAGRQ